MYLRGLTIAAATLFSIAGTANGADQFEFKPVINALQVPGQVKLGGVSGVAVNSRGQVFMLHRAERPVVCFEATGEYVRSWGTVLIGSGHGLRIDRNDNVWVTDTGHHLVYKFDARGELLMTLGKADEPGTGHDQFDKPTDVGFGPNGEVYVTDGYGNSRIMKFDADGHFLATWGEHGDQPGQFNAPHAVVIDRKGRVIIGDRDNDRVQIFDGSGNLQETWTGFAPFGLAFDNDSVLFVADGRANSILRLDSAGKVLQSWGGEKGKAAGEFSTPHMLATDRHGNLYVAEVSGRRVQKLVRQR
ncbi:MAG: peptidyl-alpha-hydroxyglycine alpha-amidating lyase family protein [Planctomycetaceae bacterium]